MGAKLLKEWAWAEFLGCVGFSKPNITVYEQSFRRRGLVRSEL